MQADKPDVYSYADYRKYLKGLYAFHKEENKRFSHRFIASKVQAASAGWFSDVVSGRINLTAAYISRLIKIFKLSRFEAEYFRTLVHCNQTKDLEEKNRYLELLIANRKTGAVVVSKERFMYYATWYIPVIRELLFFYDFIDDFKKLSRMIKPPIRVSEAKRAVKILYDLDFIAPDKNGYLKPKDAILRKESSFKSIHWANFQKSALELAGRAVEAFNKDERDISSVLISLSPLSKSIACEEIARLRKKLLELSESDKKRDIVYQCNIQLFPTTRSYNGNPQGDHHE